MIRTRALHASAGSSASLRGVDLDLPRGTVYGLLGPVAEDRALLLQLLGAIRSPDRGSATVLGLDVERQPVEVRRRVAFLPRDKAVCLHLRAEELLRFYLGFFPGAASAHAVLSAARVEPRLRLREASEAARTRLLLTAVMSREAELLLLDEPTADLDPSGAETFLRDLAAGAGGGGRGVVLATSRIDEAQRICDRVGIMLDGRLVIDETVDDLLERWRRLRVRTSEIEARELTECPGTRLVRQDQDTLELVTDRYTALGSGATGSPGIRTHPMSLREIYLEVLARAS